MWFGEPHPFPERGSPTRLRASGQQSYEGRSCRTLCKLKSTGHLKLQCNSQSTSASVVINTLSMIHEGRHKSTYRTLSELMYDSLSITQMYTSSREIWNINQSLGDTDLGFWMCPFSVSIHTQYTRIIILVAHPLKNQSSCHIFVVFHPNQGHYYNNSRRCLSFWFWN